MPLIAGPCRDPATPTKLPCAPSGAAPASKVPSTPGGVKVKQELEQLSDTPTLDELLQCQSSMRLGTHAKEPDLCVEESLAYTACMGFGKHEFDPIRLVPEDYFDWVNRQPGFWDASWERLQLLRNCLLAGRLRVVKHGKLAVETVWHMPYTSYGCSIGSPAARAFAMDPSQDLNNGSSTPVTPKAGAAGAGAAAAGSSTPPGAQHVNNGGARDPEGGAYDGGCGDGSSLSRLRVEVATRLAIAVCNQQEGSVAMEERLGEARITFRRYEGWEVREIPTNWIEFCCDSPTFFSWRQQLLQDMIDAGRVVLRKGDGLPMATCTAPKRRPNWEYVDGQVLQQAVVYKGA